MTFDGFPIPVDRLYEWVPHRPPLVWVDEVVGVTESGGECLVRLDPTARYMGANGAIRPSSFIEWMAQAYAYVRAAQQVAGVRPTASAAPKRAYLVSIASFTYQRDEVERGRGAAIGELKARVEEGRTIGPITLVDGVVTDNAGKVWARAKLKVFAE